MTILHAVKGITMASDASCDRSPAALEVPSTDGVRYRLRNLPADHQNLRNRCVVEIINGPMATHDMTFVPSCSKHRPRLLSFAIASRK